MLTIWDFLALALIALAAVAAVTHAVREATRKLTQSKDTSKDITFDVMMARVAATGWHFALEGKRYRIWHANDFARIKREILTSTDRNDVALWLHALGCLGREETFAGCKPHYIPVDAHDYSGKPADRLASRLYTLNSNPRYGLTDYYIGRIVIDVLVRETVDHPALHALRPLARAFVSGRAVSEAEVAGLIAAFDMDALTAGTTWHSPATAGTSVSA